MIQTNIDDVSLTVLLLMVRTAEKLASVHADYCHVGIMNDYIS